MKEKIESFLKLKKELTKELKEWVLNIDIPLDERWDVFIKSNLGKHDSMYYHFISFDEDDFYSEQEKYQYITPEMVLEYFDDESEEFKEKEIQFKEEILREFLKSWDFDW